MNTRIGQEWTPPPVKKVRDPNSYYEVFSSQGGETRDVQVEIKSLNFQQAQDYLKNHPDGERVYHIRTMVLKRGALKCPCHKEELHFEILQGMRVVRDGWIYTALCPQTKEQFRVKADVRR